MTTDESVNRQTIRLIEEKLKLQEEIQDMKLVNAKILERLNKEHADEIAQIKASYQRKAEDMIRKIISQYLDKSAQLMAQHQALEKQLEKQYEKELAIMSHKKLTAETNMRHMHDEVLKCKRIISDLRKKQANYAI